MYFSAYTPIFPYEVMMRMIPNFLPRGHGMYIIIHSETKEDTEDEQIISPKMFGIICNALAIRRFGIGGNEHEKNVWIYPCKFTGTK